MLTPVLVLTLVAWLAAPTPEVAKIPGTKLRLGMTLTQANDVGAFVESHPTDAGGAQARQGSVKFFGVACQATLYFREGYLARAHLEAGDVSPNTQDYVEDQLRRAKMQRECTRFAPGDHACDWLSASVKIHLEIEKDKVDARIGPPARPWETEPETAAPAAAAAGTAPAGATPAEAQATPSAATTGTASPGTSAPPTAAATNPAPASASPSGGAAPVTPPPAPAAPAVAPEKMPEPVATLPETLKISLPERNASGEWPRMTTVPKLVYPEAARRESVQGVVWLLTLVDVDGTVKSATVDRGIRELNDAALAWITKARFAPCVNNGHPCRFWVRVAARFTLF